MSAALAGAWMAKARVARQVPEYQIRVGLHSAERPWVTTSVLMASACAPQADAHLHEALAAFAMPLSLAFQIQHDLLGAPDDTAARERTRQLHARAVESLEPLGTTAEPLRALADWLLLRTD